MKKLSLILTFLSLSVLAMAIGGTCGTNLTWSFDETSGVITISGTGAMTNYAFGKAPWYGRCSSVQSVVIEEGVTTIGTYAFYNCQNLKYITIPRSLSSVEDGAFVNTNVLAIDFIGTLEDWCLKDWWPTDVVVDDIVRTHHYSLYINGYRVRNVIIPDNITNIKGNAFTSCFIDSVIIHSGVTNIEPYAFSNCKDLVSVTINSNAVFSSGKLRSRFGEQVTEYRIGGNIIDVPNDAFKNCEKVKSIAFGSSVQSIDKSAFSDCERLTSIEWGANNYIEIASDGYSNGSYKGPFELVRGQISSVIISDNIERIPAFLCNDMSQLTSVSIGNRVKNIGKWAFRNCKRLSSVVLTDSITTIEEQAFAYCDSMISISMSENIIEIGRDAFISCYMLHSITLPNTLKTIGVQAFRGCIGLETITIPSSVINIGDNAFSSCKKLESIFVDSNNLNYSSHEGVLFSKDAHVLIKFPDGKLIRNYSIPDGVYEISKGAFSGSYMSDISIPNSVRTIGMSAFSSCEYLTSITIPNDITNIEDWTFSSCTRLSSVMIGDSVAFIGNYAFFGCSGLASITCKAVEPPTVGTECFSNVDKSIPLYVPAESVEAYQSADQWRDFTNIQAVVLEPVVEKYKIGDLYYHLDDSTRTAEVISCGANVETTNIPTMVTYHSIAYSVTSIGDSAFYNCTALTSVTIPNSVTSIGNSAFDGCPSLASVHISDLAAWCNISFGGNIATPLCLYLNDDLVTSLVIPGNVTSIGDFSFSGCNKLTSVTIPNSVTNIGKNAFFGCSGLASITCKAVEPPTVGTECFSNVDKSIPLYVPAESVEAYQSADQWRDFTNIQAVGDLPMSGYFKIGDLYYNLDGGSRTAEVTGDNSELEIANIPASVSYNSTEYNVTSIGDVAFGDCYSLISVTIPNSVASIGDWAFSNCMSLTSIEIPNSVTSIGDGAFSNCMSLTSIEIPNNVTSIGQSAFDGCTGLTAVNIPNNVTSIGNRTFSYCTSLTSIKIPRSVRSIGISAFCGCTGLTSITCVAAVPPSLDLSVFKNVDKTIPLYVPIGSINAYKTAEQWQDFSTILPIDAAEIQTNELKVTTSSDAVEVCWPSVSGACFYELKIKDKDGNDICTLVFDAQGHVQSANYVVPSRNGAPQREQELGFIFTITNLEGGSSYDLTIIAKDSEGNTLDTKTISFTTQGDTPTVIGDVVVDTKSHKLLHNGQIYILRGDKTYTVSGQEVK